MRRLFALLSAFVLLFASTVPAAAQSILRDAETEALLQDMVDPLVEAAGMDAGSVKVYLVDDNSINAFVATGQRIFIHTGLIAEADNANQVQGVMAHELGHIVGGHSIRIYEGASNAMRISLLTTLAGIAAALAGGGEAAMGVMALGQQAAMSNFLSFSRTQEASADAASVAYLHGAGITGRGALDFFGKLQSYEFRRGISQDQSQEYGRSHPLSGNRIAALRADYEADAAWDRPSDPQIEERFSRIKAKLYGFQATPERTLTAYPPYLTGIPARYARAYAYHHDARMDEAMVEADALIAAEPNNPYFLELKGQILLESGHAVDSLAPLRRAVELSNSDPLIAPTLGHALVATENPAYLDEAERVLRAAVGRDRENPFAWYQLGVVYGQRSDFPRAQLASAEQQVLSGNFRGAFANAGAAEAALPTGSPDWLRAQDIGREARVQIEREEDRD
ncbi:MAG: M48 family metalloprotease [Alteraurantiacibacter sp.]